MPGDGGDGLRGWVGNIWGPETSRGKGHTIKGVLIVHNETATGVTSDVAAIRRAIDAATHPAMLYVDGVSSIASKALAAHKNARCARTFFDFGDQMKANATGYFPYTPRCPCFMD
jgi:alanine-glyoxylate transaminase / serine-glyoxylate transaminase / serine-pyruvate transaminase